jgi:hypothetical protein
MIGSLLGSARHERILRLLDLERRIILKGPLSELKAVVDRREAVLTQLLADGAELPESFVAALKRRAERNSRLLLASLAGLKAAQAQVERIERARDNLRTYSATGAAIDVKRPAVTRDHRA